jgi:hypothetical protein
VKDSQTDAECILYLSRELFVPNRTIALLFAGRSIQMDLVAIDGHVRIKCFRYDHVAESSRVFGRSKVNRFDDVQTHRARKTAHDPNRK